MAPGRQAMCLPCKVSAQTDDTYGDGATAPGSQRSCGPSARPGLHFTWTRVVGFRVEVSHSRRPVRRMSNPQTSARPSTYAERRDPDPFGPDTAHPLHPLGRGITSRALSGETAMGGGGGMKGLLRGILAALMILAATLAQAQAPDAAPRIADGPFAERNQFLFNL